MKKIVVLLFALMLGVTMITPVGATLLDEGLENLPDETVLFSPSPSREDIVDSEISLIDILEEGLPLSDLPEEITLLSDIPEKDIPLTEEKTPLSDDLEENTTLTDIVEEDIPLSGGPEEDTTRTDIIEQNAPLSPQTGEKEESSALWVLLSAIGAISFLLTARRIATA